MKDTLVRPVDHFEAIAKRPELSLVSFIGDLSESWYASSTDIV